MSSTIFSGNTMVISHFHDFYYLEALMAQMAMASSANAELKFKHSFVRLEADIAEEFARLSKSMALRIHVYLWAAALGEARHADGYCEAQIKGFSSASRQTVYKESHKYMPVGENLQILKDIYTQKWNTRGFGGAKWLQIAEGIEMYGNIPDAAFIDHAADLEHNGGCVFNKDTQSYTNLYCYGDFGYSTLKFFLDYKFKHNILDSYPDEFIRQAVRNYGYSRIPVSRKTYSMVQRFANVVKHIAAPVYLSPVLETLSDYSVEWGNDTLQITGRLVIGKDEKVIKQTKTNTTNTTRLHVGDTVKIVSGNCRFGWNADMENSVGERDTIKHIHNKEIYLDHHMWTWSKKCLQKVTKTSESAPNLHRGQTVQIIGYDNDSHGVGWVGGSKDMPSYVGKTATVKTVSESSYGGNVMVKLDVDGGQFWWAWQWVAPITTQTTETTTTRERRRRYDTYCESCGDGLSSDESYFSDVTGCDYCESCFGSRFATCDKCGDEYHKDDLTETPNHHKYYHLCNDCIHDVMFRCPECDEWHDADNGNFMEDTYEYYCDDCAQGHYCRRCNELHADIRWHNRHEHKRTRRHADFADLQVDGDGVFEYAYTAGDFSHQPEVSPTLMELHIKGGHHNRIVYRPVKTFVYKTDSPYLFVYDTHDVSRQWGHKSSGFRWAIHHTKTGLLLNPHVDTWQEALEKTNAIAGFDWNFTGNYLPRDSKWAIKKILGY